MLQRFSNRPYHSNICTRQPGKPSFEWTSLCRAQIVSYVRRMVSEVCKDFASSFNVSSVTTGKYTQSFSDSKEHLTRFYSKTDLEPLRFAQSDRYLTSSNHVWSRKKLLSYSQHCLTGLLIPAAFSWYGQTAAMTLKFTTYFLNRNNISRRLLFQNLIGFWRTSKVD